jgi:hypothetical protein
MTMNLLAGADRCRGYHLHDCNGVQMSKYAKRLNLIQSERSNSRSLFIEGTRAIDTGRATDTAVVVHKPPRHASIVVQASE